MADLQKLMNLPGALAAFEFSDTGELVNQQISEQANLDSKTLDLLCHVCVANRAIATMQARGWENLTGSEGFYPVEGFSLIGMDWSAVIKDRHGVVLANHKADYQAAFDALAS